MIGFVILAVMWLVSVVTIYAMSISCAKGANEPYTVGNAVQDFIVGSIGCGWMVIMLYLGEKAFHLIAKAYRAIKRWSKPFMSKRIF